MFGGGESRAFFVPHADPFDLAAANGISERIERISDQSENLIDADFFERTDQNVCDSLGHGRLLIPQIQSLPIVASFTTGWSRPHGNGRTDRIDQQDIGSLNLRRRCLWQADHLGLVVVHKEMCISSPFNQVIEELVRVCGA
jgi:hypothetical protein